ncbi:beta-fructofuranosidase, soluble isoenzyme I isoform X2 [Spinacia oleracea]|uniref:beta-fructofuranosidase n=1 Tax=Spinacia oleracea TaxID=3562 RepID=A0ABM3RF21_SPIOL|nr:beta-fructofuranosidase, soluble isoenzyme I-like isoform X2 [Spinacia oleracea]
MAFHSPPTDLETTQPLLHTAHNPTQARPEPEPNSSTHHKPIKGAVVISVSCMVILTLMGIIFNDGKTISLSTETTRAPSQEAADMAAAEVVVVSRGIKEGVSEKVFRLEGVSFPWTNEMLRWQRSGFHFQPEKNWMNGPLYYNGYYHLFYQYNPDSAVWGNITWGHAISTDMIHWKYLPLSMVPDQWYDINGVWTGSATILPDGNIMMVYTGDTDKFVQVQNLAYPANLSDPLLLEWVKYSGNPVLTPPEGIGAKDFRDPTTAWVGPDGMWRIVIGSKKGKTGITLVYKTKDFKSYELEGNLHGVPDTGMWECVDFYPVSTTGHNGLDTSAYGPGMKHLLKASLDDTREDVYALGTYDVETQTWTPDNPEMDVGIGLRLDYGKFYASKTFFDQKKQRRILWGWVGESDTEADDLLKGWSSLQSIPRVVTYDAKTGTNVLQWPVKELDSLRTDSTKYGNLVLQPGSTINLNITSGAQLDVSAEFVVDQEALKSTVGDDVINNCSSAAVRQALGPFGLLVLADESLSEFTPVYFYIAKASDGSVKNWFCTDQSRSSKASTVDKKIYGGPVPVLEGEKYRMRLLVDHSIVEAFGQGGRTCVTSRIYPTKAINREAKVFLFNNATDSSVTASVKIWKLDSAHLGPYRF